MSVWEARGYFGAHGLSHPMLDCVFQGKRRLEKTIQGQGKHCVIVGLDRYEERLG